MVCSRAGFLAGLADDSLGSGATSRATGIKFAGADASGASSETIR
jgi:hypothetical protein